MRAQEIRERFHIKVPTSFKLLAPSQVIPWNADEYFGKYRFVKKNCEALAKARCKHPEDDEQWQKDWDGVVAECGGSVVLNVPFNYTIDTYKDVPDVGPFEVRFSTDHESGVDIGKMFRIYDRDPDDAQILVVGGKFPNYYYYGYVRVGLLRYMVFKCFSDEMLELFINPPGLHNEDKREGTQFYCRRNLLNPLDLLVKEWKNDFIR